MRSEMIWPINEIMIRLGINKGVGRKVVILNFGGGRGDW